MRTDIFETNYLIAMTYFKEYGDLLVEKKYEINGYKLGNWINNLRALYKRKDTCLTKEHVEKLEAIGMIWDKKDFIWDQGYQISKQYYEKYGNLLLKQYEMVNGYNLGQWINNQRARKSTLTKKRIDKLDVIGMVWNATKDFWNRCYDAAKRYYIENGDLLIPSDYIVDGLKVGIWMGTQKSSYKENSLTKKQIDMLELIGMIWYARDDLWENQYQLSKQYFEEYGNLLLPRDYDYILHLEGDRLNML